MALGELELALPAASRRRLHDWARFGLVGVSGIVVNQILLVLFTELAGIYYVASAIIATFGSSTWNFVGAERWAFRGRRPDQPMLVRYGGFLGLNLALLVLRVPTLWLLTERLGIHYTISNLISLVVLFALRLLIADTVLWGERRATTLTAGAPDVAATASAVAIEREARHHYNVAGLLAIESDVELRELRSFEIQRAGRPDIRIRVGFVRPGLATKVTFEERGRELVYQEHLGPLAANFSLRMGDPIEIKVSPILALSPHVVYTNIVEAFLRFLLVSKGYVLLHSAALAGEHGATLLSAPTDTGKTSTVISLVRAHGYRFLSDDMTIIDPSGVAVSYPKPMTLSFHTMNVAKAGRLTTGDRARLAIQSRLHSKSGRQVGRALGERNLPIMTINSLVQFLVPPPKHRIDSLFECEVGGHAPIRNVVLMGRGEERMEHLSTDEMVDWLVEMTDDAYGFPPFARFAPMIRIGDDDYPALRRKEAALLRSAISNARLIRLVVPGHEWAERLPDIIDRPAIVPVGPGESDGLPVAVGPGQLDAGAPVAVGPGITPAQPLAGLGAPAASLATPYAAATAADEADWRIG